MIITAPTGLYKPLLPQSPQDSGNITFIISNNSPPRSKEIFLQLPTSELVRREPEPEFNKEEKRVFAGPLIYDVTTASTTIKGSGSRQFEIGELLEFEDFDDEEVDTYSLNSINLRQDLKVIDYSLVGLSEEEVEELKINSLIKQNKITNEISDLSSRLKNNNSLILNNQSDINNSQHIYHSIVAVLGEDHPSAKKAKFKMQEYEQFKNELLSDRKELQLSLDNLREELNNVREVVR